MEGEDGKEEQGYAFSASLWRIWRRSSGPMPNHPDRIASLFHQFSYHLRCSLQSTGGKQIRLLSNLFLEVGRLGVWVGVGGNRVECCLESSTAWLGCLQNPNASCILQFSTQPWLSVWLWMEISEDRQGSRPCRAVLLWHHIEYLIHYLSSGRIGVCGGSLKRTLSLWGREGERRHDFF